MKQHMIGVSLTTDFVTMPPTLTQHSGGQGHSCMEASETVVEYLNLPRDAAQLVECLSSTRKALGSVPKAMQASHSGIHL